VGDPEGHSHKKWRDGKIILKWTTEKFLCEKCGWIELRMDFIGGFFCMDVWFLQKKGVT